jgi:hypothetical protein
MSLPALRAFRVSLTLALSLAIGYGLAVDLPFIAPIFALIFTASGAPPRGPMQLLILVIAVTVAMGIGLLVVPLLLHYPATALLLVALGVYAANHLAVNLGKGPVAMLLTMSLLLISSAGTLDWGLAVMVIDSLTTGIVIAIVCSWVVYPFFAEKVIAPVPEPVVPPGTNRWLALRATMVVMPVYWLALTNPAMYLPIIMKTTSLGQQTSTLDLKQAGRELLGSTFTGGCLAIGVWFALSMSVNLWMFFLWILLFTLGLTSKLYQIWPTRLTPGFWTNAAITMLILLGSAVQDSATGKDVYMAFAVRMGLFVGVTLYAWFAVAMLEHWRMARTQRAVRQMAAVVSHQASG